MPKGIYLRTEEHKRKIRNSALRGERNPLWQGGEFKDKRGNIFVLNPDHPFCDNKGYIRKHRLIMEQKLSRYLNPKEDIHHLDYNKENNHPSNLYLFPNRKEHTKYHHFLKNLVLESIGYKYKCKGREKDYQKEQNKKWRQKNPNYWREYNERKKK